MDFQTTHATPVSITVDGTPYQVPRFRLPQFEQWAALMEKKAQDDALAKLGDDPEVHARFLMFYRPAAVDVQELIEMAGTPDGVKYVVNDRLEAAGVPVEQRGALIETAPPGMLRTLAGRLLSADRAMAAQREQSGDPGPKGNPTSGQSPSSGDSPTTTGGTVPPSSSGSPASTQAA